MWKDSKSELFATILNVPNQLVAYTSLVENYSRFFTRSLYALKIIIKPHIILQIFDIHYLLSIVWKQIELD